MSPLNFFYLIVVVLGLFTSYTDIKSQIIKNSHLLGFFVFGFLVYSYFIFTGELGFSKVLIFNFLAGCFIGFLFYWFGLWAAGDAKLFIVYVFLIPQSKYSQILYLPSIALFANIFLISFAGIILLSGFEIAKNKRKILQNISFKAIIQRFLRSFLIIFSFGWIVVYLFNFVPVKINPLVIIVFFYLFFLFIYKVLAKMKNKKKVLIFLISGIIIHFLVYPQAFSFEVLSRYFIRISFFTFLFLLVNFAAEKEKEEKFRIPFAPFMFLGAVTLESGLIHWVMNIYQFLPFFR